MTWKAGDWVVFDLSVGQIKELREGDGATFSDGSCETSGMLVERFRPLTLRNKRIVENFAIYYDRLREIDGEAGFNYPRIHQYFAQLALDAIDSEADERPACEKAQQFVVGARDHKAIIQGVPLFRPTLRRAVHAHQ